MLCLFSDFVPERQLITFKYLLHVRESALRPKISSEKMVDYAKTAFAVDPRIALALASRFPTNNALKGEVTQLVQVYTFGLKNEYFHFAIRSGKCKCSFS